MANPTRICGFAILVLAAMWNTSQAETVNSTIQAPNGFPLCRVPVTKAYRIQPEFCPQQLVAVIQQNVQCGGSYGCCGPYGIPPIFVAGQNVVIRQSPEMHARIAKFLTDMGATIPPTVGTP